MDLVTRTDMKELLQAHEAPCVSIFMPTHRGGAEQDPILFRKDLAQARETLVAGGLRAPTADAFLTPAQDLVKDNIFWKNQSDGLALFLAPGFFRLFRLPRAFENQTLAGNRFHLKPLLPFLSGDGRFFVLALSQNGVRLLAGTRFGVSEVDLKGVPRNLAEALIRHDTDEILTFHSRPAQGRGSWNAIFSGHGVGIDNAKDDLLLYFRAIDRALVPFLREERTPLLLAAVDYLQPIYREANSYSHLLPSGIAGNPDHLSARELHDRAWPLVTPLFDEPRAQAAAQYERLLGTGRTACGIEAVLPEAYAGRIQTLFVASDRHVWGVFDPVRGSIESKAAPAFGTDDLLDLAAAFTLAHGHAVHVMPMSQVPGDKDVAAILHVPMAKHQGKRP
ncbi:MAG: hypothetical protein U0793_30625 [Gemmataceae bacterium]